ncbi:MAG: 2-(1,2-epoxy,2-dihydrophenyl)acetyl-CoA isomerase [Mycobacterium sp.]|nr:2-(1,2-epoxy,2-dihydrophenyl)acetyl-CoA isomerase [Mycobacterium sp.]
MSQQVGNDAADGSVTAVRDGAILRITLDRPAWRNSLNHTMIDQFVEVLTEAATDDGLRALHVKGAGDDFCTGADLVASNSGTERPRTGDLVRRIPLTAHRVVELLHTIALPVVCTVRGWAVGLGCNLALAADFTVADTDAVFWEPFLTRGFSPDSGSTWLLPRLVGLARARRMLLLGEQVSGTDAADWGLIHHAAASAELDAVTEDLLVRLAQGPTVALGLAKQAINSAQHAPLDQAMKQELFNLELSCRTTDFKEGLAALRDRRPPTFNGR